MFHTHAKNVLAFTLLISLGACTQPGTEPAPDILDPEAPADIHTASGIDTGSPAATSKSTSGTPEQKPENLPSGHLQRPIGIIDTPGPGVPSGPVDPNLTTQTIQGDWALLSAGKTDRAELRLVGNPGSAAGRVELQTPWPFDSKPAVNWMFLAFGQLTLSDEDGIIVWSGQSQGADYLSGHLGGTTEPSDMVRNH